MIVTTMFGFLQYTYLHHSTIDNSNGFSIRLGEDAVGKPNVYMLNNILAGWSVLGVIYFMCDPIVGTITYAAGLLAYLFVTSVKELDSGEDAILKGSAYTIFLSIHVFGWLT